MKSQVNHLGTGSLALLVGITSLSVDLEAQQLPFELRDHLIVVQASIDELEGVNLVIDTGATLTCISHRVAKALGLQGKTEKAQAFGNRWFSTKKIILPSLQLGPSLRFEQVEACLGRFSLLGMRGIDGVIGLDILKQTSLSIDYERRWLAFGSVHHAASKIAFYARLPFIILPMKIGAQHVQVRLDTGTSGLILYRSRLERRSFKPTGSVREVPTLTGRAYLAEVTLPQVSLGPTSWSRLAALVWDGGNPSLNVAGHVGPLSLGFRRLNLDFQHNLISWER